MHESRSDEDLLLAARAGDGQAFAAFYRRHVAMVVAQCRRATGSADTAADLTAEVFAATAQALPRFRPERGAAVAWLRGIARNKARESLRRGRVEDRARRRLGLERLVLEDADLARVEELAAEGAGALAALEQLPEGQRDAVRAHVLEERDYAELAASLRCSEAVVRQRVSRGLARLRERLEDQR